MALAITIFALAGTLDAGQPPLLRRPAPPDTTPPPSRPAPRQFKLPQPPRIKPRTNPPPPPTSSRRKKDIAVTVRVVPAAPLPTRFLLEQNYPNPVAASTSIRLSLPTRTRCNVAVFDVAGKRVATLVNQVLEPGTHAISWDACDDRGKRLLPGVYFYRAVTPAVTQSRKLIVR